MVSCGMKPIFLSKPASCCAARCQCRAMRRSESMHKRMKHLVDQAKMITEHNQKRQELVGIRWACLLDRITVHETADQDQNFS